MHRVVSLLPILLVLVLALGACFPGTPTGQPAPAVQATEMPTATEAVPAVETPAATEAPAETAGPSPSAAGETPAAAASPATTATGETTLVVWDQFYRDVESGVIAQLNEEFEASHPGLNIERVTKVLDDLNQTVKLALAEPDGPDVSQVNQGRSDMGALVQAGLLLPLDQYAERYNWDQRFSAGVNSRNRFSEDGTAFGEGNLYGVSPTAEVVGVYYNKNKFSENGWEIPATFAEFEQLLADILAAGETPIAFGNLDGWPGIHEFSAIQHTLVTPEYLNDLVYGRNNVSFDTPENQQAAETFQNWAEQGYFTEGFSGIGYDDITALFKSGQGVLEITGSWLTGELQGGENDFGFFLMPQRTADGKPLAVGGVGVPYAIRKTTAQPDLAAEYLDWMTSPRAAELWAQAGFVPAMPLPQGAQIEEGSLFADTVAAWQKLNEENGVGHYIDWATPTFYDTLVAELQKLLAGETTPAQFTAAVQDDYSKFLAGNQ